MRVVAGRDPDLGGLDEHVAGALGILHVVVEDHHQIGLAFNQHLTVADGAGWMLGLVGNLGGRPESCLGEKALPVVHSALIKLTIRQHAVRSSKIMSVALSNVT